MTGIFVVTWTVLHFIMVPCKLQNPTYAEHLGMNQHYNCPASHGGAIKIDSTPHSAMSSSKEEAEKFWAELIQYKCEDYAIKDKPWADSGFDCVKEADYGDGFSTINGITRPQTIFAHYGVELSSK